MTTMTRTDERYFSWTARQLMLGSDATLVTDPVHPSDTTTIHLDVHMTVGAREARLVTFACLDDEDDEWTALLVGDVSGASEVPVRTVEEERLLLAGARSTIPAEILVAVPPEEADMPSDTSCRRIIHTQLCMGGPIRDVIGAAGAVSVVVNWSDLSRPAA
ncbi:hypothetical protein [Antrihabitans sp. YC2-6]|uniref:hypothetical protein n=1 Tax=Antrihabitans sp. YC2-6 TaxID=2799498 RepID=UPI0018F2BF71|nr:hypothetical protein [Antrihabitans sp. YC2-6]MBJ8345453.1 hypothetical protein [Antrihabitans sp. YC2-6]